MVRRLKRRPKANIHRKTQPYIRCIYAENPLNRNDRRTRIYAIYTEPNLQTSKPPIHKRKHPNLSGCVLCEWNVLEKRTTRQGNKKYLTFNQLVGCICGDIVPTNAYPALKYFIEILTRKKLQSGNRVLKKIWQNISPVLIIIGSDFLSDLN